MWGCSAAAQGCCGARDRRRTWAQGVGLAARRSLAARWLMLCWLAGQAASRRCRRARWSAAGDQLITPLPSAVLRRAAQAQPQRALHLHAAQPVWRQRRHRAHLPAVSAAPQRRSRMQWSTRAGDQGWLAAEHAYLPVCGHSCCAPRRAPPTPERGRPSRPPRPVPPPPAPQLLSAHPGGQGAGAAARAPRQALLPARAVRCCCLDSSQLFEVAVRLALPLAALLPA